MMREKKVSIRIVPCKNLLCLGVERYIYSVSLSAHCLMGDVGQYSVMDVVVSHLAEVTDSASYQRLEHEEVTCHLY